MEKLVHRAEGIINNLAQSSLKNGIIREEDLAIYRYGMKHLFLMPIYFCSYLIIGIATQNLFGLMIYLCFFTAIRVFAGGFHMQHRSSCFVGTMIIVAVTSMVLREYERVISLSVWMLLVVAGYTLIMLLAPIDSEKRIFDEQEKIHFRKASVVIANIELVLFIITVVSKTYSVAFAVVMAFIQEAILIVLGKMAQRRRKQSI